MKIQHRCSLEALESRIAPATILVTSLVDDGSDTATEITLREAIDLANNPVTHAGPDTITFAPTLSGKIILTGGRLIVTSAVNIKGPGPGVIQVSGGNTSGMFQFDAAGTDASSISGLALIDGAAKTDGSDEDGGLIRSAQGLTLTNVILSGGKANNDGGAVYVHTAGKFTMTSSKVIGNSANMNGGTGNGGGLFVIADGGVKISKSVISGNSAHVGGGIDVQLTPDAIAGVVFDSVTISNNTALLGGGGLLDSNSSPDQSVVVKNSVITGNRATDPAGGGGGISHEGGLFVLDRTTVSSNSGVVDGGGMSSDGDLTVKNSRFEGNRTTDAAGSGGGGLEAHGPHTVLIQSSFFIGNQSANDGGGVLIRSGGGDLGFTLKQSTVTGNFAADLGGGIAVFGAETADFLTDTVTGNTAGNSGGGLASEGVGAQAVKLTVSGGLFRGNTTINGSGGGIHAIGDGAILIKGAKVLDNSALEQDGGGLNLSSTTSDVVMSCLIARNAAEEGGGGLAITGNATIISTMVLDNSGFTDSGGGIVLLGPGSVSIMKSTITGNVADDSGGGIFRSADGTATVVMSKVFGNVASTDPQLSGPITVVV